MKRLPLLAAVLLAGCGGGGARPVAKAPPMLAHRCGAAQHVPSRTLWFTASDGTRLDGAEIGGGPRGVILLHESPSDLCGWVPYGDKLASRRFHVLLVDLRAFGLSQRGPYGGSRGAIADVRGAVDELKRLGAKRVALVGASYGGVTAMVAAPALDSRIAGIATLSGELELGNAGLNALGAVHQIRVPFLIMGSRQDRYLDAAEAKRLAHAARATNAALVEFDGSLHGWDLLSAGPQRQRADDVLLEFLNRVTE